MNSYVNIPYNNAYMYKREMKHYENGLEFQWFYQGFKNIFWFV